MAAKQAVSGFPYPLHESQVMNAWERLVCGVELPADAVRTVIERSWVRCHSAGVDPATTRAPSPTSYEKLSRLLARFRDVIDVGVPVMEQVRESLSESGTMMILTDPSGVILKTEGDPATLEAAEDVRLVNGANWDELVWYERDRHGLVPQGAGADSCDRAFLCGNQTVVVLCRRLA